MIEIVLAVALGLNGSGMIWLADRSNRRHADHQRFLMNHIRADDVGSFVTLSKASLTAEEARDRLEAVAKARVDRDDTPATRMPIGA